MCTSGRCSSNPGKSLRLENKTGFNQNSAGFAGHAVLFPSVLMACDQDIIFLLPKSSPGFTSLLFGHRDQNGRILAGQVLRFFQWTIMTSCSAVLSPFFFWLCMCVCLRERDVFACVQQTGSFNSPVTSFGHSTGCNCQMCMMGAVDVNGSQRRTFSGAAGYC